MKSNEKAGSLYLCQFNQGTIKIGMGTDAAARLASHKAAAAVFGITVVRTDVVPCDSPRKAEKLLIEWCGANSTACNGREWFNGVHYEACLAAAKSAASAMMGPHPYRRPKPDILELVLSGFGIEQRTKEADLYTEVRELMVLNQIPHGVLAALDYLHRESEMVRATMRVGGPPPEWYDLLNCFEFWEVELWFDKGRPSAELLSAAAEAVHALAKIHGVKEVVNA